MRVSHGAGRVAAWAIGLAIIGFCCAARAESPDATVWTALKDGGIVLFRHANAPGVGDPPGMKLGDCKTQRNLDETGRAQARQIGRSFQAKGVSAGRVIASQWCRAMETAELAFPGRVEAEPEFNSFFDDRSKSSAQTERARKILLAWRGPDALVVVTHQVNIQALIGQALSSGEGVVVKAVDTRLVIVGRIKP